MKSNTESFDNNWEQLSLDIGKSELLASSLQKPCKIQAIVVYVMGFIKTHKLYKYFLYSLWVWVKPINYTANMYSQTAVEVHWKTCLLSKSTVLRLQLFYKYFIVLVVNNNCYYYRYFNAFVNAGKLKCKVQLITAPWNTEKLM